MSKHDTTSGSPVEKSELLKSENILDGFFHVQRLALRHTLCKTGAWSPTLERYILHRPDAVCAVVYHRERASLYFVRQFRVGTFQKDHGWLTELAAGLIDEGETPEQAIEREVREELGFQIANPVLIQKMYTTPGIINERVFLFYTEVVEEDRLHAGGGNAHEHEDLEIVEVPVQHLDEFMQKQDILDAKTIVGIQWFLARQQAVNQ